MADAITIQITNSPITNRIVDEAVSLSVVNENVVLTTTNEDVNIRIEEEVINLTVTPFAVMTNANVNTAIANNPAATRIVLELGSAALNNTGDFATAAQGMLADTAVQPSNPALTDSREWTAATVEQAEAEAGVATTRRAWTAERVKQAIIALADRAWTSLTGTLTLSQLNAAVSDANLDDVSAARTPTSHAASHATGGSDPITAVSIGAATEADIDSNISAHIAAIDPHGDRVYTDAEITALNLGNSATLDVGTTAGTVAAGDDIRFGTESGESIFFLEDEADSIIAGYKVMDNPAQLLTEAFVTQATIAEGQIIEEWITATGHPGVTFIPDGAWQMHINAYKTGGTKSTHIYVEVYKRVLAGTETLLGTTALSIALTGVEVALPAFSVYIAGTTLLDTDRIVAKVRMSLVGGGSNPTSVTVGYSGSTAARLTLPAQALDITTIVMDSDIGVTVAPMLGANDNYVTDAEKVVIGNTSGTNTGDQASIVGITGTKAQFDTAVTDGNIAYTGDAPTAHAASHTNGTDDIQSATAAQKGLATAAQITKLDGIAAGATANSSDATLLERANHTGTQAASTITGLAASATTDTTNASNISSGTLPAGRLPAATTSPLALVGVTDASSATAGQVGEVIETSVLFGSAVALSTATTTSIATVALTAGQWRVEGSCNATLTSAALTAAGASVSPIQAAVNSSVALPTGDFISYSNLSPTTYTQAASVPASSRVISVSGATTYHLIARATFSSGTVSIFGYIRATRIR